MTKNNSKYIFFVGKGGVGKSTVSALTALAFSGENNVLLVSMDPAHNQSDIFQKKFSEKPRSISNKLYVLEIDTEKWIKKYLHEIETNIRRSYTYLTAFNLEKNFNIIKYSPGMEEYALLMAFNNISEKFADKDYIIFDMPPTALTMRFFTLPSLSLLWNDHLIKLREEIIKKKELITKIKVHKTEFEFDKILKKLREQKKFYSGIKSTFENKHTTKINLVLNTDTLSITESERILTKLKSLDTQVEKLIINKSTDEETARNAIKHFNHIKSIALPLSKFSLIGIDALKEFLKSNQISA